LLLPVILFSFLKPFKKERKAGFYEQHAEKFIGIYLYLVNRLIANY
jgi:hypothetical protein